MRLQSTLGFPYFFAVNFDGSLDASVIQFTAASFTVPENAGQASVTVQRTADLDPDGKQFSRNRAG